MYSPSSCCDRTGKRLKRTNWTLRRRGYHRIRKSNLPLTDLTPVTWSASHLYEVAQMRGLFFLYYTFPSCSIEPDYEQLKDFIC